MVVRDRDYRDTNNGMAWVSGYRFADHLVTHHFPV
jgi:hypothetical protein